VSAKKATKNATTVPVTALPDVQSAGAVDKIPSDNSFAVVGIGASAGGLAAFEAFFSGIPVGRNPAWLLYWYSTWRQITKACWPV
jgi:two-component system CheB/CheR fusion protein